MNLYEYFGDWLKVIDKAELYKVVKTLHSLPSSSLCPSLENVFKAFELCRYNDCKVIFLGQDPYPQRINNRSIATGILFGNYETDEEKLSPSLKIIKDCVIDLSIPHNNITFDNSLESWAKQGILMINSALTCEVNNIGSHTMMWRPFTSKLLRNLSEKESGLIYVLFGKQAQTFKPYINKRYNDIIEVEHPSYFARNNLDMPNIFKDIDKSLLSRYNYKIIWFTEL